MSGEPLPQLGRYRTIEVLGTGAMGVVYKAHDPGIDRLVALKTIRKELVQGPTGAAMVARFRNEAVAAGRLNHSGIVTVYEFGEDQNTAFIAMELAQGVNLSEYVSRRGGLRLEELKELMAQLLEALDYAHRQGVVHRDIKPANLLVSDEGRLKVTDFGIARLQDTSLTLTAGTPYYMAGTPYYMAPEQYQGTETDHRADLFAAGVILYELLIGEPPFKAATVDAVAYQVCHVDPPAPTQRNPHVPPELDAVIAKALAKPKERRFASGREFAAALGVMTSPSNSAVGTPLPVTSSAVIPVGRPSSKLSDSILGSVLKPGAASPLSTGIASTALSTSGNPLSSSTATTDPLLETAPPVAAWNPATLRALEDLLTPAIGPIAKVLVKRGAAQAKGYDDLCARLAAALTTDDEKVKFTQQAASLRPPR